VLSLGVAAIAKTSTYLLLRYFVDTYLGAKDHAVALPLIAAGFVALAMLEGGFSFNSGRLAAMTAEGITRRLRNYLFDHIQHLSFHYHSQTSTGELIQRSTSDVDWLWTGDLAVCDQLYCLAQSECDLSPGVDCRHPGGIRHLYVLL
jgi:ATP-binding cassette subfamily B protein